MTKACAVAQEASPSQNTECSFSELGAHGATSPCLVDGVLVTTSQNKMIYGLSLDGRLAWKHPTSKRIRSPPRCFSSTSLFLSLFLSLFFSFSLSRWRLLRGASMAT